MFGIFKKKEKEPFCTKIQAKRIGDRCPHCGETRKYIDCLQNNTTHEPYGVCGGLISNDSGDSIFDNTVYYRYHFKCMSCTGQWRSPRFPDDSDKEITVFPQ